MIDNTDAPPTSTPAPTDGVQSSAAASLPQAEAQSAPAPTPQAAPAQQPPDQKQPFWKALLQGAIRGLAGAAGTHSFGGGLAGGAAAEQAGQQRDFNNKIAASESAAGIRFQDLQSAKAAADINRTGLQIAGMNEDLRQSKEKFGMGQVDFNQKNFGTTYKAVPFTQDNARLYLQQASNGTAGAHVPDGIVVTPSTLYIPVSDSENSVASDYAKYKSQGDALGLNTVSRAQYMSMNPAQRRATAQITNDIFSGTAQPQQVNSRINALQSAIDRYKLNPNADPGMLAHMNDVLAQYQNLKSMNEKDKDKDSGRRVAAGVSAAKARNDYRGKDVINPETGALETVLQKDAIAGHMTPASHGVKAQQGLGLLNEIDVGALATRQALTSLKTPFTPDQQVQLSTALKEKNGLLKFAALNTLSPDQQHYVTAMNSLREGAMSYRAIAGQGQGSDQQRQALFNALPNPLQPLEMQIAALDRFDQQRQAIRASIPKVNNRTLSNTTPAPTAQHQPGGKAQGLTEGATGTGSDGKKYVVKGGVWVSLSQ